MPGSTSWGGRSVRRVAFSRRLLNEDEDLVLDLHPHWWFLIEPMAALVAATVLGIWALASYDPPGWLQAPLGVVVLAALGWFGLRYLQWITTNFVVTTDRLIYRHGVIAKHGIEIPLERVNTVFFSQSIFERVLGSGDLVIESAGEQGRQAFSDVRKPSAVQNEIYRQMEANENRKFDRIGRRDGGGGGGTSIPEQIEQLDDLRRRGVLTDAEFQAKKADLLRRM
jgi:membrane protein YdbS with pleckstrin-like domain